jgi:hypothetical protein
MLTRSKMYDARSVKEVSMYKTKEIASNRLSKVIEFEDSTRKREDYRVAYVSVQFHKDI